MLWIAQIDPWSLLLFFFIYFIYNDNYDTHTTVQPLVKEVLRSPT